MDLYVAMAPGAVPEDLAGLEGLDVEITGPDYRNGYTLEGGDSAIAAVLAAMQQGREIVRFFIIL